MGIIFKIFGWVTAHLLHEWNMKSCSWLHLHVHRQIGIIYRRCPFIIQLIIRCVFIVQGDIGLNVAQMIVELIRDNRKIVDRITRQQIDEFINLLRSNKVCNIYKSASLQLLHVFVNVFKILGLFWGSFGHCYTGLFSCVSFTFSS